MFLPSLPVQKSLTIAYIYCIYNSASLCRIVCTITSLQVKSLIETDSVLSDQSPVVVNHPTNQFQGPIPNIYDAGLWCQYIWEQSNSISHQLHTTTVYQSQGQCTKDHYDPLQSTTDNCIKPWTEETTQHARKDLQNGRQRKKNS